jgi:hypothetical protein
MSFIACRTRAVLKAAVLTALASTACTDATGPTAAGSAPVRAADSSTSSPTLPREGGDQAVPTTPKTSFLVSTGVHIYSSAYANQVPGRVTYSPPSVVGGAMGSKTISVGSITIGDLPNTLRSVQTSARTDFYLWRYNGSSWVKVGTRTATSMFPWNVKGSLATPVVTFSSLATGYYAVTFNITWLLTWYDDPVLTQSFSFNSASDYYGWFGAKAGPGWIYLP